MRPDGPPVGLQLAVTSKAVSRAFNAALADAGGSVPIWLVLSSLKSEPRRTQLDLARAVGIDPGDRRAVRVELTDDGERLFAALRKAVIAFNKRLTAGLGEPELIRLQQTLTRLQHNVRAVE